MASGYIGKISAIVTANTSDLSRKLSKSSAEANKFATSLRTSIDRAGTNAQKSLEKIFTPLQQLERQLKAASSRSLKLKLPVDDVRAFVSAAEAINKPLERASSSFSKLSTEVQAAFIPSLQAAQAAAVNLNQQIAETGKASASSFQIAASEARKAEQAIQRLSQAQQIAARGLTGRELQFSNPAAFSSLNRTAELTQQAGRLPAGALEGSDIANRVAKLNGLSQSISVGLSKLESLRIDPTVNTTQIEQAEKKLNSLLAAARRAQDGLRSAIDVQANIGASSPFISTRDPQGRSIPERLSSNLLSQQLQDANNLAASQQELARKIGNGFLTILTPAEAAADTLQAKQQALARKIGNGFLNILTPAEAAADTLQGRRQAGADSLSKTFGADSNQQFFDTSVLKRQQGELTSLRELIGRVSLDVRGPLAAAFQRYAVVVSNALQQGEDGFEENTQDIQRQRAELIKLIATTRQVGNVGQITGQVNRAGDIGRGGFDKFSLAINQAAFAVDDFFSATGGLEFKLRAVQNNITQLGFVAGGTRGLIAALAGAIGGQLVIAVLKSTGVLDKEKDTIEALNKAYSEQESRIQRLAQLYQNLGSSIRDAGLDEAGRTAAARARELADVKKAEEEVRVSRAAASDVGVVDLLRQREEIERRAKEAPTAADRVVAEIDLEAVEREIARATREAGERVSTPASVEQTLRNVALASIDARFDELEASANREGVVVDTSQQRQQAIEEFERRFANVNLGSGEGELSALKQSIDEVEENLKGLRGLRATVAGRDPTGEFEKRYEEQLRQLTEEYAALQARVREAAPGAALVRFVEASFAVADTLDRARENLDQSGIGRSLIGDEITAVSRRREELRTQADQARAEGDTARLDALTEQISALAAYTLGVESASAATRIFADTLKRLGDDLSQTVAQEARSRADSARRRANEAAAANLGLPGIFGVRDEFVSFEASKQAEEAARDAEKRSREVRQENQRLLNQFIDEVAAGGLGRDVQQLVRERADLQGQIQTGSLSVDEQRQAELRIDDLDVQLRDIFERSAAGRRATENANQADIDAAEARLLADSQIRGESLIQSDVEKSARDVIQSLVDIKNAAQLRIDSGFGINPGEAEAARARVLDDARRSVAPALSALQDSVANAVLQGPSRAALNAADVTTTQGTAELNRLLRGDDPARDQNLLELQKQTGELVKLNQTLGAAGVAD